jgi:hypothetical protein
MIVEKVALVMSKSYFELWNIGIMLSVALPSVVMLSVVIPSVVLLSVIITSVVMLSAVMMSVMVPKKCS